MLSYDTILFHGSVIAVDGKHRLSFNIYVRIMTFKALKLMKGYGGIFTRTALRERSIPFIISAPITKKDTTNDRKMEAFKRLETSRPQSVESFDYDKEREETMNAKYGQIWRWGYCNHYE